MPTNQLLTSKCRGNTYPTNMQKSIAFVPYRSFMSQTTYPTNTLRFHVAQSATLLETLIAGRDLLSFGGQDDTFPCPIVGAMAM